MTTQISFQASLTVPAKRILDDISEKTGVPQKQIFSKLFEWFAEQPSQVRKAILWPDEGSEDIDTVIVALEYLQRRRAEVLAAEKASRSARGKGNAG
jgi:hypothetical protein